MKLSAIREGDWRRLLVDTLVVLIGVLAALVLNNIREDMVAERAARIATERLLQEVAGNAESLQDAREVMERRLSLFRELREDLPAGKSMNDLLPRFHGYWFVDLNSASWEYLSRSALADSVDPELLQDAFDLYSVNKHFDSLSSQIQDFVYSEIFVSPDKIHVAMNVSEAIMRQQLRWAEHMVPEYEKFLARYSGETGEGGAKVALK
ncbi:hypothetical protein [Microbulbifer rhizosphaerae]|uniref:Uncharacterized protein n=1 Tax=Microbulbifer rhizosphaerae TaxID=1562603 RepID=A0A7W4ZAQ6_9GAMM|nr:hypothetical protein [Microbulbifer rhizosphaerae]MBB3063042.1 hypothetical protein [Microbulbifer rhizosphaerae]